MDMDNDAKAIVYTTTFLNTHWGEDTSQTQCCRCGKLGHFGKYRLSSRSTRVNIGITFTVCYVTDAMVSFSEQLGTGVCSCEMTPQSRHFKLEKSKFHFTRTVNLHHKVRYVRDENARLRFLTNNRLFYIFQKNFDAQDEFILHHEEYASEPYRISACDGSVMMNTSRNTTDFWKYCKRQGILRRVYKRDRQELYVLISRQTTPLQ